MNDKCFLCKIPLKKLTYIHTDLYIIMTFIRTYIQFFIMTLTTTNATNKGPTKNVQTNFKPNNTKYILKVSMR